jgi:uncharacterized membrane protein YphA (DoxX/SURF4 family)
MTSEMKNYSITALRWTLGLVVGWQSVVTAWMAYPEIHAAGHQGVHAWIRLILGSIEAVGAILLLFPLTTLLGGWILIAVFLFAILFHALRGEFNFEALLVYGAAAVVCMAHVARGASRAWRD